MLRPGATPPHSAVPAVFFAISRLPRGQHVTRTNGSSCEKMPLSDPGADEPSPGGRLCVGRRSSCGDPEFSRASKAGTAAVAAWLPGWEGRGRSGSTRPIRSILQMDAGGCRSLRILLASFRTVCGAMLSSCVESVPKPLHQLRSRLLPAGRPAALGSSGEPKAYHLRVAGAPASAPKARRRSRRAHRRRGRGGRRRRRARASARRRAGGRYFGGVSCGSAVADRHAAARRRANGRQGASRREGDDPLPSRRRRGDDHGGAIRRCLFLARSCLLGRPSSCPMRRRPATGRPRPRSSLLRSTRASSRP